MKVVEYAGDILSVFRVNIDYKIAQCGDSFIPNSDMSR